MGIIYDNNYDIRCLRLPVVPCGDNQLGMVVVVECDDVGKYLTCSKCQSNGDFVRGALGSPVHFIMCLDCQMSAPPVTYAWRLMAHARFLTKVSARRPIAN